MSVATRIALVEFVGYREWTEELGNDREWIIQSRQSKLYMEMQQAAARYNGYVMPIRYDYMIALVPNVGEDGIKTLLDVASSNSDVPVRIASSCGATPLHAEEKAWRMLAETRPGSYSYEQCNSIEYSVVAHIDIDNITSITKSKGVTTTYYMVIDLLHALSRKAESHEVIVQYLGGDNILALLPPAGYPGIVEDLVEGNGYKVKAGVGAAPTARASLALAAAALHDIRTGRATSRIVYYSKPP